MLIFLAQPPPKSPTYIAPNHQKLVHFITQHPKTSATYPKSAQNTTTLAHALPKLRINIRPAPKYLAYIAQNLPMSPKLI